MSDLWGCDATQGTNAIYPGDNGDFTEYDRFLTQFVADIKANSMTTSIKLLIWNEPDLSAFWTRGMHIWGFFRLLLIVILGVSQYLSMWSHTVKFLR